MATIPDLTNAETWTDDDLDALRVAVATEQERRTRVAAARFLFTEIFGQLARRFCIFYPFHLRVYRY